MRWRSTCSPTGCARFPDTRSPRPTRFPDLDIPPEKARHPRRVMAAFAERFGEDSAEVEVLRLLGLFDRPATKGAIDALRRPPPIPGLTDHVSGLDEAGWLRLLERLRATRAGRAGEHPCAGRGGRASAGAGAFRGGAAGEASRGLAGGARAAVRALQGAAGEAPARHAGGDGAAVPGGVPRLPGGPASRGAGRGLLGADRSRASSLRHQQARRVRRRLWRRSPASSIRRGRGP